MAEISRQQRQLGLHVGTRAVPLQQAMASKSMTNVMNAWAETAMATAFPAYQAQQLGDAFLNAHTAVRPTTRIPKQRGVGVGGRTRPLSVLDILV